MGEKCLDASPDEREPSDGQKKGDDGAAWRRPAGKEIPFRRRLKRPIGDARQERRDPDRFRPSTRLSRDSQADQRIKQDKSHVGGRAIIRIAKRKAKFGI